VVHIDYLWTNLPQDAPKGRTVEVQRNAPVEPDGYGLQPSVKRRPPFEMSLRTVVVDPDGWSDKRNVRSGHPFDLAKKLLIDRRGAGVTDNEEFHGGRSGELRIYSNRETSTLLRSNFSSDRFRLNRVEHVEVPLRHPSPTV